MTPDGRPVLLPTHAAQYFPRTRHPHSTCGAQRLSEPNQILPEKIGPFLSDRPAFDGLNDRALEASLQAAWAYRNRVDPSWLAVTASSTSARCRLSFARRRAGRSPRGWRARAIRAKISLGDEGAYTGPCGAHDESSLFFHYVHELDIAGFKKLQQGQNLMVDFAVSATW